MPPLKDTLEDVDMPPLEDTLGDDDMPPLKEFSRPPFHSKKCQPDLDV